MSRRSQMGWLSLLLLGAFGVLYYAVGTSSAQALAGSCLRMGLAFGVLWLALPSLLAMLNRVPGWYWSLFLLGMVLVVVRPAPFAWIAPPLLLGTWFLLPRRAMAERENRAKRGEKSG